MMRDTERARALGLSPAPRSRRPEGRPERRAEKRHVALLRVALLHAEGTRELCVVKNLSASGLSVRLYRELETETPVQIEFRSGEQLSGSVVWKNGWDVGILFPEPIDVAAVLGSRWITESGRRRNLPRIEIGCDGRLGRGSEFQHSTLVDISQGGARVRTERLVDPGSAVLDLPGLPPIPGVVRWATDAMAGISFNECLSFEVLARWIQARRGETGASSEGGPDPADLVNKASGRLPVTLLDGQPRNQDEGREGDEDHEFLHARDGRGRVSRDARHGGAIGARG